MRKPNGYWTKERCMEAALLCSGRSEFGELQGSAYNSAHKNGWLDEVCSHMVEGNKPNGYWTKERCMEVALLCSSRTEFIGRYSRAYVLSKKNGWLDEVYSHMVPLQKPHGYWTKERCMEAALKCKTKVEFKESYGVAQFTSYKNGWIDEVCSHMVKYKK